MKYRVITDFPLRGKTVLIRVDMNVPVKNGKILDKTRIKASLPSIQYALDHGAAVIIMTHLGRPKEGEYREEDSVKPIAREAGRLLGKKIKVLRDWQEKPPHLKPGEIVMLENVRFNPGEKANSPELSKQYARLADIFVNDAFGTAHRAQASTVGVARCAEKACCGLLLDAELKNLEKATRRPEHPILAIVGGSKVSTKLEVLEKLAADVDQLIVGGGIANTFLLAGGINVGNSLVEESLIPAAKKIMAAMAKKGGVVPLPEDVYVAREFTPDAPATLKKVGEIEPDEMILDFGPETLAKLSPFIANAKTIIWNGPIGVFEWPQFSRGTETLARDIAQSSAFSIAGGGETLAAISAFVSPDKINYVSTGGGAFLEFLEGKTLPAVAVLLQ